LDLEEFAKFVKVIYFKANDDQIKEAY